VTVGTFERIWPWLLFAGAGVLTLAVIRTWRRGWLKDEDGVVFHRKDHPRSFLVNDLLGVASVAIMIYVGFGALNGWK
jgi:hypothetical protein